MLAEFAVFPSYRSYMNHKRLFSIDVVRATAILLMIQVHFMLYLSASSDTWNWLKSASIILGCIPAPMFTFLVGLSLYLWEHKRESDKWSKRHIRNYWIKRGLFIFIFGLLFAAAIWQPHNMLHWDILTLIGASILLLFILRKTPVWGKVIIAIAMLLVSPPLRELTNYYAHWHGDVYRIFFTVQDVSVGFFLAGYFPLLPWFVFPLLGYAVGELFFDVRNREKLESWGLGIIGLTLITLATIGTLSAYLIYGNLSWYISYLTFYPASTTFMMGAMGITIALIWVFYRLLDMRKIPPKGLVVDFFSRYSYYSLSAYIIHHVVIMWSIYITGWLIKGDPWYYYKDAVSPPMALMLALAFIIIFYFVLVQWDRKKGKYSFEWILRKISG